MQEEDHRGREEVENGEEEDEVEAKDAAGGMSAHDNYVNYDIAQFLGTVAAASRPDSTTPSQGRQLSTLYEVFRMDTLSVCV